MKKASPEGLAFLLHCAILKILGGDSLLELFLTFAKCGLFTLGGGYAMIGVIEDACVEQKKWISHQDMMDLIVIAESTPGPIAINCATYVGYKCKGVWGAVAATLGMVLPSFVIIYLISRFLDNFLEIPLIANAFRGMKAGVGIVILNAGWKMLKKVPKKPISRGIVLFGFGAMLLVNLCALNFSSITLMLLAGIFSLAVFRGKAGAEK